MRNHVIYIIHTLFVVATAYILFKSGLSQWYWILIIAMPLVLTLIPGFRDLSYTLNVRVFFPVSVGLFAVSLYHYFPTLVDNISSDDLHRYGITNRSDGVSQEMFEVNPIFKDAVSVLYALCAAFLLWKGLSDFDELKVVIYEEAAEVKSISDYLSYFMVGEESDTNPAIVRNIRLRLLSYLCNMLAGREVQTSTENEDVLEEIVVSVGSLATPDKNDEIALEEIMKGVSHIGLLRSRRAVCIEKRMSPFILVLIFIMSCAMVSTFFNKATGELGIDYIYVFLLPLFYSSILMTLVDLSTPFDGYWSIKLTAVRGVQKRLCRQMNIPFSKLVEWEEEKLNSKNSVPMVEYFSD